MSSCMLMHVCLCEYVYVMVCMHSCKCAITSIPWCMSVYSHAHLCACLCVHVYPMMCIHSLCSVCMHMCAIVCINSCMCVCMPIHAHMPLCPHVCALTCMYPVRVYACVCTGAWGDLFQAAGSCDSSTGRWLGWKPWKSWGCSLESQGGTPSSLRGLCHLPWGLQLMVWGHSQCRGPPALLKDYRTKCW